MGYNVGGGAEPQQMRVGTTAIQKVMVGSTQVWPKPITPVQYVSGAGFTGTWTHAAGDLLLMFSQGVSSAPPAPPAPGGNVPEWLPFISGPGTSYGGSTVNLAVHYAWATTNTHNAGSWSGLQKGWVYVLRNADKSNPFGSGSLKMDSSGGQWYPTCPALTMEKTNSSSFTAHMTGWNHTSTLSWSSQPTGATTAYVVGGSNGLYVGHRLPSSNNVAQVPQVAGQLNGPANACSGLSLEIVPARQ